MIVAVVLTAELGLQAFAFPLGASRDEVAKKFGAPQAGSETKDIAKYFWGLWELDVSYHNGYAHELVYRKIDPLTDAEIEQILKQNGNGMTWRLAVNVASFRQWWRADFASATVNARTPREIRLLDTGLAQHPTPTPPLSVIRPASFTSLQAPQGSFSPPPLPQFSPAMPSFQPNEQKLALTAFGVFFVIGMVILGVAGIGFFAFRWYLRFLRKQASEVIADGGVMALQRIAVPSPPVPRPAIELPSPEPEAEQASAFTGLDFEVLIAEIYRRLGYQVEMLAADGGDGGVDITMRRFGEVTLVQCKHWKSTNVTVKEIREFVAVVADQKADRGIFVTSGNYTYDAREFGTRNSLEMVDGDDLRLLINQVLRPGENLWDLQSWIGEFTQHVILRDPTCPFCRSAMKLRKSRYGLMWGCVSYPRCKGKRNARTELMGDKKYMPA